MKIFLGILFFVLTFFFAWGEENKHEKSLASNILLVQSSSKNIYDVYFIGDDISNTSKEKLVIPAIYLQCFSDATIYAIGNYSNQLEEKEQHGIKIVFIKKPQGLFESLSGIAIDRHAGVLYFVQRNAKGNAQLCKADLKSGNISILFENDSLRLISIPVLSPDRKKIAFYYSSGNSMLFNVGYYNLETAHFFSLLPEPVNMLPLGPFQSDAPLWAKSSEKLFFTARDYTVNSFPFCVYSVDISSKDKSPYKISNGGFPIFSGDIISITDLDGNMMRLKESGVHLFQRNAALGKLSDNHNFIVYMLGMELFVGKVGTNTRQCLNHDGLQGAFYWWMRIKE